MVAERTVNGVVITDPSGRIAWINAGFTRITGYSLEEVLGRKPGEVLQGPDTDKMAVVRMRDAIHERRSFREELVNYRKNGRKYWVQLDGEPLFDDDGTLTGFMAIQNDVTERKLFEQALAESEMRLRTATEGAGIGVWDWDVDTGQTLCNPKMREIFGVEGAVEMTHDMWRNSIVSQEQLAEIDLYMKSRLAEHDDFYTEYRIRRADGELRDLLSAGTVIARHENNEPRRIIGISMDITNQRKAEQELRRSNHEQQQLLQRLSKSERELRRAMEAAETANRAKSSFLANMSHEIRTPMTAILGYADFLAEKDQEGLTHDQRLQCVQTIRRNGEYLLAIINDILDLSKIEAGQMEAECVACSPLAISQECVTLLRGRADEKGIALQLHCDPSVPIQLKSDPIRLRQILLNLLGNAIKFTPVGRVDINLNYSDSQLMVSVSDTGIGISVEQQNKLFKPFSQADSSTTRRFGGSGLGLAISKRLAQILGGDIVVQSEVGKGSCFTLSIPVQQLPEESRSDDPSTLSSARESRELASRLHLKSLSGRVLLAEDGQDTQRLLAHILRLAGATVTAVDTGRKVVEALTTEGTIQAPIAEPAPFDLVLMDIQMPEMDGYTAATLLRRKGSRIPIVALTANAAPGDRDRCLKSGCNSYLPKPINHQTLLTICEQFLSQAPAPIVNIPTDNSINSAGVF